MLYDELTRRLASIIDTADFDVAHTAKELGYTTGTLMQSMHNPDCLDYALRYEPKRRHDAVRGMYKVLKQVYDAGFRHVGYGYFSTVVRHEDAPGVVFKLSMRTDDAYAAYALWARDAKNPHAPVFHSIQRGRDSVVFCLKEYITLNRAMILGRLPKGYNTLELKRCADANKPNTLYRRTVVQFVRSITKFFKGVSQIDLHNDNAMYDTETRRVIITDPVSFNKIGGIYASEPQRRSSHPCTEYSCALSEGLTEPAGNRCTRTAPRSARTQHEQVRRYV